MIRANEITFDLVRKIEQETTDRERSNIESWIDAAIYRNIETIAEGSHICVSLHKSLNTSGALDSVLEQYKLNGWYIENMIPPGSYHVYEWEMSLHPIRKRGEPSPVIGSEDNNSFFQKLFGTK